MPNNLHLQQRDEQNDYNIFDRELSCKSNSSYQQNFFKRRESIDNEVNNVCQFEMSQNGYPISDTYSLDQDVKQYLVPENSYENDCITDMLKLRAKMTPTRRAKMSFTSDFSDFAQTNTNHRQQLWSMEDRPSMHFKKYSCNDLTDHEDYGIKTFEKSRPVKKAHSITKKSSNSNINLFDFGNIEKMLCEESKPESGDIFVVKRTNTGVYNKDYYKLNKGRIDEYYKDYYNSNRGKILEKKKKFNTENKKRISDSRKVYYKENQDKIKKASSLYRLKNIEKVKFSAAKHYQKNICKKNSTATSDDDQLQN